MGKLADIDAIAAAPAECSSPLSDAAQLAAKDKEIAHLGDALADHPMDKPKTAKPVVTMSTEADDVPVGTPKYWVAASGRTQAPPVGRAQPTPPSRRKTPLGRVCT